MITHKSTSCGYSSIVSKFTNEVKFQFLHKVVLINEVFFNFNVSVVVGQVSMVDVPVVFLGERDELRHVHIGGDRLSDVIDLSSCVAFCGVREENDVFSLKHLRRDVEEFPFWRLPDAMELRLNQNRPPDMNAPSNMLFSAICGDLLWNDSETFISWLSGEWPKWNKDWVLW